MGAAEAGHVMAEPTLKQLAEAAVREALENGTTAEKLTAVAYVLSRPKEAAAQTHENSSATLIVHLDGDGNLKEPPREGGGNEALSPPHDPDQWTELHADQD